MVRQYSLTSLDCWIARWAPRMASQLEEEKHVAELPNIQLFAHQIGLDTTRKTFPRIYSFSRAKNARKKTVRGISSSPRELSICLPMDHLTVTPDSEAILTRDSSLEKHYFHTSLTEGVRLLKRFWLRTKP